MFATATFQGLTSSGGESYFDLRQHQRCSAFSLGCDTSSDFYQGRKKHPDWTLKAFLRLILGGNVGQESSRMLDEGKRSGAMADGPGRGHPPPTPALPLPLHLR